MHVLPQIQGELQTNIYGLFTGTLLSKHTTPLPNPGVSSQKLPLVAGVLDAFQGSAQVLWVTDVWNRKRTLRCAYRNLGGSSFAIYYEGFLDTPSSKSLPSKHQLNVGKVQTVSNHKWDVLCFVSKCPQTNCLERFPRTANHHKRRCLGSPKFQQISAYRIIKLRVRRAPSIGALWSGLRSSYVEFHRIVIKKRAPLLYTFCCS